MHTCSFRKHFFSVYFISLLAFFLVVLPLPATVAQAAAEPVHTTPATTLKADEHKVVVLDDHKKEPVSPAKNAEAVPGTAAADSTGNIPSQGENHLAGAEKRSDTPEATPPETKSAGEETPPAEEGLSMASKVAIGAGVFAVVGGVALLAAGGDDSGPEPKRLTADDIVGVWNAVGTSTLYGLFYRGIFVFAANGHHSYDLLVSDGTVKKGNGSWTLTEETRAFVVKNDYGSTYSGVFQENVFKAVSLVNSYHTWHLDLTKQ